MNLRIRSISTKLSIYILTITTILFVVSFSIYYQFSSRTIIKEAFGKSSYQAYNLSLRIEAALSSIDQTIDGFKPNIAGYIEQRIAMRQLIGYIMDSHPEIYGVSVIVKPEYQTIVGEYTMIYGWKENQDYKFKLLDSSDTEQFYSKDWFRVPVQNNLDYWSEPYYQELGGDSVAVVTYSSSLISPEGEFVGVVTADLPVEWLNNIVQKEKPFENSYTYLISKKARYLSHKDPQRIVNETFFTANQHLNDSTINELGQQMIAGQNGHCEYVIDDVKYYEFYNYIKIPGWSVAIVSLKRDIIADLIYITVELIIIVTLGLLFIFLLTIFVIRRTTHNIKDLSASTKSIAQGNFDVELTKIKSRDEIYELRESFVNMQHSLKDYIKQLKISTQITERINSELTIATEIQMGMLPTHFPPYNTLDSVECYAKLIPAKEVGGDLYDFIAIDDIFYFTVGDASGKGVPASLLMTVCSSLFRYSVKQVKDPGKVLSSMNNLILEKNSSDMFITMFIGALNMKTGEFCYSNAGHNPPVIIRENRASFIEQKANLPLGIMPDITFATHTMNISTQDILVLYTDGLTEAENSIQELYSNNRLLELLSNDFHNKSSRQIIESIDKSVCDFTLGNEQSDDITTMVVRPLAKQSESITLKNNVTELAKLTDFLEQIAQQYNLSSAMLTKLNIALEEAVSNVILYGFPGQNEGESFIELQFTKQRESINFTIIDSGIGFDPTSIAEVDTTLPQEKREIGGLGILLLRKIMDKVEYKRQENKNILSVTKRLEGDF